MHCKAPHMLWSFLASWAHQGTWIHLDRKTSIGLYATAREGKQFLWPSWVELCFEDDGCDGLFYLEQQHSVINVDNGLMSSRKAMGFKATSKTPGSSSQPSPAAMAAKQGYAAETRRPTRMQHLKVNRQR